jgi:hypothetical protein
MALGQLVNGKWTTAWTEQNVQGQFQRMPTQFRQWITADNSDLKAEFGRYHLYISLGCPWAHRTALLWKLKGLENTALSIFMRYTWPLLNQPFREILVLHIAGKCCIVGLCWISRCRNRTQIIDQKASVK